MKKIINGKKYDTDTAKLVGSKSNGGGWRDFNHYEESMYLKKTGEFFLSGEGGPMTKYAVSEGQNSWSGGSAIIPMTHAEAREWAEKAMDTDAYEALFGPVEEDESKQTVTLYMTRSLVEKLKREAREAGTGLSALIETKLA
jgi:hypothetical protein